MGLPKPTRAAIVKCSPQVGLVSGIALPPLTLVCTIRADKHSKGVRIPEIELNKEEIVELVLEPVSDPSTQVSPPEPPVPPASSPQDDASSTPPDPEDKEDDDKDDEEDKNTSVLHPQLNSLVGLFEGLGKVTSNVKNFLNENKSDLEKDGLRLYAGYQSFMKLLGLEDDDKDSDSSQGKNLLPELLKKIAEGFTGGDGAKT